MSLSLAFLLIGAALVAGSSIAVRATDSVAVRSISAGTLAAGALVLVIGLANALSGTA